MEIKDLPEKTLLTPEETARFFSVSKQTIYNWCEAEAIQWCKPNGILRIFRQSAIELLNNKNRGQAADGKEEKPTALPPKRKYNSWVRKW